MKKLLALATGIILTFSLFAQVGKNQTVKLNATANADGTLTLSWPAESFTGSYAVLKRQRGETAWNAASVVPAGDSTWQDTKVKTGEAFEYAVAKRNSSNQTEAVGYILGGNKYGADGNMGGIILVIDSNFTSSLANEISQLTNDLAYRGWTVYKIYAGRSETPTEVKKRIVDEYKNAVVTPRSLYLLGHIPVPYSGYFSSTGHAYPPDGHAEGVGNHTGAWPADVYYADMSGTWTDNSVYCTTGSQERHHNIEGDGKFDQTTIPGKTLLETGRVDFYDLPAFGKDELTLMKDYLSRVHQWKEGELKTVERGLIDDNFKNLDLSRSGWNTLSTIVPRDSIFENRDYLPTQVKDPYLWSFGMGAGSYTNCNGIGKTINFAAAPVKNIFTSLSGSYFGDWDYKDALLRATLASGSLASMWGGIPFWHLEHMGLGENIGYCARVTQLTTDYSFNGSHNKVHIALMGDPTLTIRNIPTVTIIDAKSNAGNVDLTWNKVKTPVDGYNIYRVDKFTKEHILLNDQLVTDTFFSDTENWYVDNYVYRVRAVKLETTPSGSYYNMGGGKDKSVYHSTAITSSPSTQMDIFPNPSQGSFFLRFSDEISSAILIEVSDLTGKVVYSKTFQSSGDRKITLPGHLSGMFMVQITGEKFSASKKILILNR